MSHCSLPVQTLHKTGSKKDSKQRIGYGCIYHFFSLEFLYADTDNAESKIDKPIVAIIRMISIWSMRFIPKPHEKYSVILELHLSQSEG